MKKFLKDNKLLVSQFNFNKNINFNIDTLSSGCHQKVWWVCDKGHEWEAAISDRMNGRGCPFCSNKKILEGYNDIFTICPKLKEEWDYKKNVMIDPTKCGKGNHKKVWWICPNGHSYETSICSRTSLGTGCPYCSGRYAINGENDLKTLNPNVLKEWNYKKNIHGPEKYKLNSHNSVWWRCNNCGNEWEAAISDRIRGNGCPKCRKELKTSMPEQILYYYIKNVFNDAINSYKIANYKGEIDIFIPSLKLGIEYDGYNWHKDIKKDVYKNNLLSSKNIELLRIREDGLPIMPNNCDVISVDKFNTYNNNFEIVVTKVFDYIEKKFNIVIPNKSVCIEEDIGSILNNYQQHNKEKSLKKKESTILIDWNWNKNGGLKPDMISYSSNKKIWWKCHKCGYEWYQSVNNRNKRGCPLCSNRVVVKGINDLATTHKELLKDWNYDKNDINPSKITYGSEKKVWWKCHKCNYEWQSKIWNRTRGRGCPLCSNKVVVKGINDLTTIYPELLKDWDYSKNKVNPDELTIGSNKKIWWKCHKCGHEWETNLFNRTTHKSKCPICVRKKN